MTDPYVVDACKMQIAGDFFVSSPLAMANRGFGVNRSPMMRYSLDAVGTRGLVATRSPCVLASDSLQSQITRDTCR